VGDLVGESSLILSFDFEDWHQLVRRRAGSPDWDQRSEAFEKQIDAVLSWLAAFSARATFFILGMSANRYPDLLEEVAEAGHEIACHGYGHQRVFMQSEPEFRRDLEDSLDVLDRLLGLSPRGYRAPAFSINRDTWWALETLCKLGFDYDSSLYDSPRVPRRIRPIPSGRFDLELEPGRTITEFPIAVRRSGRLHVPIGGGSYWRFLPAGFIRHGLRDLARRGTTVLYFHPYEFDEEPLRADLAAAALVKERLRARLKTSFRAFRSQSVVQLLTELTDEFQFVTHEDALDSSERPHAARAPTLPWTRGLV
jgi:polysaccharide deacetylase family protein (PEP-CTERM system associated)